MTFNQELGFTLEEIKQILDLHRVLNASPWQAAKLEFAILDGGLATR